MWALPFYICLALLGAALILREHQNKRTIDHLLNRLLVKHGVDPIPDEHPLAEVIKELTGETREDWPPKDADKIKKEKRKKVAVRFSVPGMEILQQLALKRRQARNK